MPNIFPSLFDSTEELEQEIVEFLAHTGALACTCKAALAACRAASFGDVCCPAQQFHHPRSAVLQLVGDDYDDDGDAEMRPLWGEQATN
jgi:hypothetical protein